MTVLSFTTWFNDCDWVLLVSEELHEIHVHCVALHGMVCAGIEFEKNDVELSCMPVFENLYSNSLMWYWLETRYHHLSSQKRPHLQACVRCGVWQKDILHFIAGMLRSPLSYSHVQSLDYMNFVAPNHVRCANSSIYSLCSLGAS